AAPMAERDGDPLEGIVAILFAVARSDGRIARKEKEIIEQYVTTYCGGDTAQLNRARGWCAHYEKASIDVDGCLRQCAEHNSLEKRRGLLNVAASIADATGPLGEREKVFLERIAKAFDVPVLLDESSVAQNTIANGELSGAPPKPTQESQPANPNALLQSR